MAMQDYMNVLGRRCQDRVTGYVGVASAVSFDLYGCVVVTLSPKASEKAPDKLELGHWFDYKRLSVLDGNPVMALPDFRAPSFQPGVEQGPAPKPAMDRV